MPSSATPGAGPALAFQPALDGLRGLCLLAVLLFHSGFGWMSGGFLGVSTFFTLSGYLITSLLLAEYADTGRVSYAAFWRRRIRRLMPAALVGITAVTASSPLWLTLEERDRLTGDALAALVYAVNWRFVQEDYAYQAIFVAPSPLQHFWSLAIEAQFYLLFPLALGLLIRATGSHRRSGGPDSWPSRSRFLLCALGALTLASMGASFAFPLTDEGVTRIYYGSDSRFAEILFGAVLAVALRDAGARKRLASPVVRALGLIALASMAGAWVFVDLGDNWLYRGGFALYAWASVLVVSAAVAPFGPVRWLLSPAWLQWIGRVSYGAYVYHWPVFLILDEARTGLGPVPLLALRFGATFGAAGVSYAFLERPVRARDTRASRVFGWLLVPALGASVALVLWSAPSSVEDTLARLWHGSRVPLAASDREARGELRIGFFGDSVSYTLARAAMPWAEATDGVDFVVDGSRFGCGLIERGELASVGGAFRRIKAKCKREASRWAELAQESDLDLAIVLAGAWDVRNWRRNAERPTLGIGVPRVDAMVANGIRARISALVDSGARVLWLTMPHLGENPRVTERGTAAWKAAMSPERADRVNELLRKEAAPRPEVRVFDLTRWLEDWPGGEFDSALREDGVHFTESGARQLLEEWLGPEIVRIRDLSEDEPTFRADVDRFDGPRVGLFGDSVAFSLRPALARWARRSHGSLAIDATRFGCGLVESGERSNARGAWAEVRPECIGLAQEWRRTAESNDVDVAVVLTGVWDARQRDFGSPRFVQAYASSVRSRMRALTEAGAKVVWLTVPQFGVGAKVSKRGRPAAELSARPERVRRMNEILRVEAARFPDVHVGELAGFVAAWAKGPFDPDLRFDLLHFTPKGGREVVDEWLGDRIEEIVEP